MPCCCCNVHLLGLPSSIRGERSDCCFDCFIPNDSDGRGEGYGRNSTVPLPLKMSLKEIDTNQCNYRIGVLPFLHDGCARWSKFAVMRMSTCRALLSLWCRARQGCLLQIVFEAGGGVDSCYSATKRRRDRTFRGSTFGIKHLRFRSWEELGQFENTAPAGLLTFVGGAV